MAILDGHAWSVMHSYTEIDGVPVAADPRLLSDLLRDDLGFTGTVTADAKISLSGPQSCTGTAGATSISMSCTPGICAVTLSR